MRKIKFRIWNGSQMVDDITVGKFGTFYVNPGDKGDGLDPRDSASLTSFTTKYSDNMPLMQFTGLKDKDEKEIYESDIVKCYYEFDVPIDGKKDFENITGEHIGTVKFDGGSFCLFNHVTGEQLIEHKVAFRKRLFMFNYMRIEILGNIYENPDLLKD